MSTARTAPQTIFDRKPFYTLLTACGFSLMLLAVAAFWQLAGGPHPRSGPSSARRCG